MNFIKRSAYIKILRNKDYKSDLESAIYFYLAGDHKEHREYVEDLLDKYTTIIKICGKKHTNIEVIPENIRKKLIACYNQDRKNQMIKAKQREIEKFNEAFKGYNFVEEENNKQV